MSGNPLSLAAGELGAMESPAGSNRTKYGQWYGWNGVPWCMIFVQWCFHQAGRPLPYRTASCSALLSWYRDNQRERIVSHPRPGDIAIYRFSHTGIVESAAGTTATAIEGNTSPGETGSQSNGGGVFRRTRPQAVALAYIRPFDEGEDRMTGQEIYTALNDYLKTQSVPLWAEKEFQEAIDMGLTDGSEPLALIPRYQAAILVKRAVKGK